MKRFSDEILCGSQSNLFDFHFGFQGSSIITDKDNQMVYLLGAYDCGLPYNLYSL